MVKMVNQNTINDMTLVNAKSQAKMTQLIQKIGKGKRRVKVTLSKSTRSYLIKMLEEMKKNDFKPTVRSADYEMSEDEIEEIKRIEEEQQAEQEKYEDAVNLYFKEIAKLLDVYEKEMIVEFYRLSQENQDKVRRYIYSLRSNENK